MIKQKNQQHPPLPKKKRADAKGNDLRRLFLKDGNTTMLMCRLTENGCKALISSIESTAKKLGTKLEIKFLITR